MSSSMSFGVPIAKAQGQEGGAGGPPIGPRLDNPRVDPVSFLFLSPAVILLGGLFIGPVIYAIYLGFTNLQLIGLHAIHYQFTGWANVIDLADDPTFYQSIWSTLIFVIGSGAVGATLIGLILAIAMQGSAAPARWAGNTFAILAWTLPPSTIAFVWLATTTQSGIIAMLVGMPNLDLLYKHAMFFVSVANAWSFAGLSLIMFSAALRSIPEDLYEAAKLEGASSAQCLMQITIPMLKPTIVTVALLMMLQTFGNFTIVYLMTGGGPGNDSNILPVYAYLQGFKFHKLGYSALLGNVMVMLAALLGWLFVYFGRTRR